MESNWRYRIAERGFSNAGIRLAAWLVEDFLLVTCYDDYETTGFYQLWEYSDPDQLPFTVFDVPIPAAHPHFPFGNDVEPD